MNCKNCGAPLHGMRCDYCDTWYDEKRDYSEMSFADVIGEMEYYDVCFEPGRCEDGKMQREVVRTKRKFTLIEV